MAKRPHNESFECLIGWPRGSVGWLEEKRAIDTMLEMCDRLGFGRVPQLANQIEDVIRHPRKTQAYQKERRRMMKEMGWTDGI